MRDWTLIDDYCDELTDAEIAQADMLNAELNRLQAQYNEFVDGRNHQRDLDFGTDEEHENFLAVRNAKNSLQAELFQSQIDSIIIRMEKLGVRQMRPYEHWNEDEDYMEYMENRYDYMYPPEPDDY